MTSLGQAPDYLLVQWINKMIQSKTLTKPYLPMYHLLRNYSNGLEAQWQSTRFDGEVHQLGKSSKQK